ncbi:Putative cytoplasmic protein [Methylophaga frappieri]|uniref:Putative cytoplasmic protein n=1 Tax=Methylophaga frappieri (strain ATCC BAA-2434 / DSM 25690 / JAM7) TaxID=754477 RepID=I1YHX7_METFJ|nr:class III extradiol ring-cleavage dioxygenase [Methylophaga frappieri]AFJ02520.1 Putative cytoplasmic protein [Methylophaga frappieri]
MKTSRRALFLSHGGGPLPLLGDTSHQEMVMGLQAIAKQIRKPSAIIVVSAHWESKQAAVTAAAKPALLYDYNGFPPAAYQIEYPCQGHPLLAEAIKNKLNQAGISCRADSKRGFDHGLFVPLKIMYPQADIPCVQLSLFSHLDPLLHINLGRALQQIADPDLLLIGSGFSFHNMRAFFTPETSATAQANREFEQWLHDTCQNPGMTELQRSQALINWQNASHAEFCHPRAEHLMPLHVCYGFAESACTRAYSLSILDKRASMYLWDAASK